ncbi:elongation factor 1-beta-like [Argentina anserina]|uniref:elongation factor 1-beta-like n=1 Tax=Argentina anserina TaxID=57926 RepID=UPI0021762CC5|nr:elongation factor 1-beta-like [Potentilla anserina]
MHRLSNIPLYTSIVDVQVSIMQVMFSLPSAGKSSIMLDVKPWDDDTDMRLLEEALRSIEVEGLHWGAFNLVPVGYGIQKMTIMLTIDDDLVSVDSLIEERLTAEPINEYVQSCEIVAFNKL